jgi:phosphate/sulfate permease
VDEKSRIKDIPEATMINFIFAVILFVFKIYSKLPMSTTWCFIGLLAGRELSMALRKVGQGCKDSIFMSLKDLLAVTFGFMVSLAIGIGGNPYMRQWAITSK